VVLNDIALDVGAGEVVGILGPNGSGKTTLLHTLVGLVRPDRGTARLDGETLRPSSPELRAKLGVVFQESSIDAELSGLDNLILAAALYGVRRREALGRAVELLEFMELTDRARDAVRTYSGGMRRRLELCRALIHAPRVLLLDEPTVGLDPIAVDRTWGRLMALRRGQSLSILLNTHTPAEAARCDRLIILDRGHIVACDPPEHLLTRVAGDVVVIAARAPEDLARDLRESFDLPIRIEDAHVLIEVHHGHELIPRLVEAFPAGRFDSLSLRRPTLADAFYHLTGHPLSEEIAS
jgi:ABC-2 type transport system ATP-binding protein